VQSGAEKCLKRTGKTGFCQFKLFLIYHKRRMFARHFADLERCGAKNGAKSFAEVCPVRIKKREKECKFCVACFYQ